MDINFWCRYRVIAPVSLVIVVLLVWTLEQIDADPKGRENSARVSKEIAKCIDAPDDCIGGTLYARDGKIIPINKGTIGMLSFWYSYERRKLVNQIERIDHKK